MKMNSLNRVFGGLLVCAAMAGSANADILYTYTAPTADAITTITPDLVFNTSPYAGNGPLFSFSFKVAGNVVRSLSGAELDGTNILFNFGGAATNFAFAYNPNDDEQPFIEFAPGNLLRPSGWDLHSVVNIAGIGPRFFESTSSFDFVRRRLDDGSYVVLSAGVPESENSQGIWSVQQVPEPGSLSLLALAGTLMFASRKSLRRKG